ncbi:MAG: Flagellar basal-body rod protein FlgG [Verrucomicrobiota bacterium]|jgi:flagellar basal-body rod protein FlgF
MKEIAREQKLPGESKMNIYNMKNTMDAEAKRQEVIARNLAASQRPGYKADILVQQRFDKMMRGSEDLSPAANARIDFTQGPLKTTGRTLDFGLQGDGFFEVQNSKGEAFFTRAGDFHLNSDGNLVTNEGYFLSSSEGRLSVGLTDKVEDLRISSDGVLSLGGRVLGKMKLVAPDESRLERAGESYFRLPPRETAPLARDLKVVGGTLEMSNTSAISQMVHMIDSVRQYELASKFIKNGAELGQSEQRTFGG